MRIRSTRGESSATEAPLERIGFIETGIYGQNGAVTLDRCFYEAVSAISKASGVSIIRIVRDALLPVLKKNEKHLPLAYTVVKNSETKHALGDGCYRNTPLEAVLELRGVSLVITRGPVFTDGSFFFFARASRKHLQKWWQRLVVNAGDLLLAQFPNRKPLFDAVRDTFRQQSIFFDFRYDGVIHRKVLPKEPMPMEEPVLRFAQAAGLWFESCAQKLAVDLFFENMREAMRLLSMIPGATSDGGVGLLLEAMKIQIPSSEGSAELVDKQK